jgi:integrase
VKANLAPSTAILYEIAFDKFQKCLGDLPMGDYSAQMIEMFKIKRLEKVSPVKVNIEYRTVRAGFSTAQKWAIIRENPFKDCRQLRIPRQRPVYLSPQEYHKIMDVINIPWFKEVVRFAVTTMMRVGEIVNLKWSSVDLDRRVIFVENNPDFRTKTRKSRVLPMDEWMFELLSSKVKLADRVFTFPDGRPLRVGYASSRFKKYVLKAGIRQEIHFHSLRHTGASWLVQNGVPIYSVQHILGHSTIQMTQVYSHLEAGDLKQPIEKISLMIADGKNQSIPL